MYVLRLSNVEKKITYLKTIRQLFQLLNFFYGLVFYFPPVFYFNFTEIRNIFIFLHRKKDFVAQEIFFSLN